MSSMNFERSSVSLASELSMLPALRGSKGSGRAMANSTFQRIGRRTAMPHHPPSLQLELDPAPAPSSSVNRHGTSALPPPHRIPAFSPSHHPFPLVRRPVSFACLFLGLGPRSPFHPRPRNILYPPLLFTRTPSLPRPTSHAALASNTKQSACISAYCFKPSATVSLCG